ncbi:MAG: hypothetical protein HOV80_27000 [Polyangiaceae bacterium]|nr:hypothetical protein [Polyangiaceae bacterium]
MTLAFGCGARTGLGVDDGDGDGGDGASSQGGSGSGAAGGGGMEPAPPCIDGTVENCGTDVGECVIGKRICEKGIFGPCSDIGPTSEFCNDLDDDCDGAIDEDFGIGQACDGGDTDLCADDVMTCNGCTLGTNEVEVCNGVDDNCNGEIDSDCEIGDCQPTLLVTGSVPSNPNCIDFPVEAGSTGTIQYPCGGGMVTATLGSISFSGSVSAGFLSLDGVMVVMGPDGCSWQTEHHIEGFIPGGALTYSYSEHVVISDGSCWQPCTEVGDVVIEWVR